MYEEIDKMQYTPMMRQYLEIKEQYKDTLVFFRLGDFYEMFFNDAILASKELEIVLTGRDAGTSERVPMCGVPFHSVDSYIDKLTEKGYKIAIVEQVENPKEAQGIVRREVIRIVTPGTILSGANFDEKSNVFIGSISAEKDKYIFCYADLSTGEIHLMNIPLNEDLLQNEIIKLNIRELVVDNNFNYIYLPYLKNSLSITISQETNDNPIAYLKSLSEGLDKSEEKTFYRLLNYLIKTQKRTLLHLQKVNKISSANFLKIDFSSRRNLELLETLRFQNKKNTLLNILDKCQTAMGSRYLKQSIMFPLVSIEEINQRFDVIDILKNNFIETSEIRDMLSLIYDLERISGKIAYESANPRDLLQLKKSLNVIPKIITLINKLKIKKFSRLDNYQNTIIKISDLLNSSISEDAPFSLKDGNIIKSNYNLELDELKKINSESKEYLVSLENKERLKTGIKNLKLGYNRVFGYYIEISKGNAINVKQEFGYIRKQTLSNAERYITEELKEKEALILRAEEKTLELEYKIFCDIRNECKLYINDFQNIAKIISEIDMLQSFTKVSNENNYVRPSLNNDNFIEIKDSRHPVIEIFLTDEKFNSNDLTMNPNDSILLITGPNMSGKSTFMRQIALISIMAQIGCFVSAKKANIPVFDQIFTRIGAADDIVGGQSTFMVEMNEVNNALKYATINSLILFDEIGRGTATYDGMALAQAIIEFIHEKIKCKTLFSTHYHEITVLENDLENLKNVHVSVREEKGEIIFIHKVLKGPADKSYGINVAKIAKLPIEVTLRANDLLNKLEDNTIFKHKKFSIKNYQQPLIFDSTTEIESEVLNEIKNIDLNKVNPIDALNKLSDLQKKIRK
ncbi:MAG: DNA mismatch repair protein MutS [Bacilli bacterium]|nr:DNA mismatch repair protein MutS [Bacilli bacterium]